MKKSRTSYSTQKHPTRSPKIKSKRSKDRKNRLSSLKVEESSAWGSGPNN